MRLWMGIEHQPDTHIAFRGSFALEQDAEVEFRTCGASSYIVWLDGAWLTEGPTRFIPHRPEYIVDRRILPAGRHVLAVHAQDAGVATRMLTDIPPFFTCHLLANGTELSVQWKCRRLEAYEAAVRRINPQFAWIDWCDTRKDPPDWRLFDFDAGDWADPVPAGAAVGEPTPPMIGPVQQIAHALTPMAQGPLGEIFRYEKDDVPARFFLRDLDCRALPPQGVWRRYDLGRIRLGRPKFTLDLPAGAVVEFAYCEALMHDRVSPWINLSAGPSCNLDHFTARGGAQEFTPFAPKGGRFMEVHILAPPQDVRFVSEQFIERVYHGPAEGRFECDDDLLSRIWSAGVETYRACSEDAITDNPTRERGQWLGDAIVGMETASAAYADVRLARRALVQAAEAAPEGGMVSGLPPGPGALSSFALHWVGGCVRLHQLTGDGSILADLWPAAVRNMHFFEPFVTEHGLGDNAGWGFIDWGYIRPDGPADPALNLHYILALRAMQDWAKLLRRPDEDSASYIRTQHRIETAVRNWLDERLTAGGWDAVGYHIAALALRAGILSPHEDRAAVEFITRYLLECFPNNAAAPRLAEPGRSGRPLFTPYFAHWAFPPLIERGQIDFVLDQFRRCWGWMLEEGRTTFLEVFDTRSTHCHQWSACPTWQMSRYILGLHPRFDLGPRHFRLNLHPRSLQHAAGTLPLADGPIEVQWHRTPQGIRYRASSPTPFFLISEGLSPGTTKVREIAAEHTELIEQN